MLIFNTDKNHIFSLKRRVTKLHQAVFLKTFEKRIYENKQITPVSLCFTYEKPMFSGAETYGFLTGNVRFGLGKYKKQQFIFKLSHLHQHIYRVNVKT